jgi:hypothetical protein
MGGGIMRYDERVKIYDSKKIIFCFIRRAESNFFGFTKDRSFVIDLKWLFRQPIGPARRFTPTGEETMILPLKIPTRLSNNGKSLLNSFISSATLWFAYYIRIFYY